MSHFWKDMGRGLLYAVPVLGVAGIGVREVLRLREALDESEARRLAAERALARADERLAAAHRMDDQALAARLRAAADAAEAQGAADERLTRVVDFLKQEVATAESTIQALKQGGAAGVDPSQGPAEKTTAELVGEISRLNGEIEAMRSRGRGAP